MTPLIAEIRDFVQRHVILKHRFLEAAKNDRLDQRAMAVFALEELQVSLAFPSLVAEVISRVPWNSESARYTLVTVLYEECGGGDPAKSHAHLLGEMLSVFRVEAKESLPTSPLPTTQKCLDDSFQLARSSLIEGLAAVGPANEFLVLQEYPILRRQGARLAYADSALEFFTVNIRADVSHTNALESVIDLFVSSDGDKERFFDATAKALQARVTFYDGLCDHLGM